MPKLSATISLIDVSDGAQGDQVSVFCSFGTQIINGQGEGAVYVKVVRDGAEIDPLYSERFLKSPPSSASSGDYYYHINTSNKTVTLKKYNGSSWQNASETYSGSYDWEWRDKDGNVLSGYPSSGKVVYIEGTMIDEKITANVTVAI